MNLRQLSLRNVLKNRARSVIILLLAAILSFSLAAGGTMLYSFRNGVRIMENRMGADCIVTPYMARSMMDLDRLAGQGIPGAFYMDKSLFTSVLEKAGDVIAEMTSQYYIGSLETPYSEEPLHLIGFYPQSDFYVRPWVTEGTPEPYGEREIVVGADVDAALGGTLRLLGLDLTVAGRMEATGTQMDASVYAAGDTLRLLNEAAAKEGVAEAGQHSPDTELSCIYLKAADGYTAEEVNNTVNIYVRKVQSTAAKAMLAGISDSLSGVSSAVLGALAFIALLAVLILAVVFHMTANSRRREFSVLRVMGVSGRQLAALLGREALVPGAAGGLLGLLPGLGVTVPLTRMMEARMKLPRLLPGAGTLCLLALAAFLIVAVIGPVVSRLAVRRLCRADAGTILRGGK